MSNTTRRQVLKMTAGSAASLAWNGTRNALAEVVAETSRTLAPGAFRSLTLGEVRPAGWLQRQLRIQADGLSGHLDEFWPDVGSNSGWLGGTGESWERGPYFLDGLIPLAYLLNDDVLKAKAHRFTEWTLTHQAANGMIGPPTNEDWWPRMVMVKALAQHHEVTGDPRVLPALTRYFHYQLTQLPSRPLKDWGMYRWQDEVLIVEWLFDRTHDPKLLDLADLLQKQGYDWLTGFQDFKYKGVTPRAFLESTGENKPEGMQTHGVNNGQALKTAAVQYRMTGDAQEQRRYHHQLAMLDRYHGMPNGMFSCDEHLAGLDTSHGTELCTVVETMFSMGVALATFGDPAIADRMEKIAFNALPGTFTDDMWAHQYDQQPNQIQVGLNSKPWTTNSAESNLYGLEPHFGCCTANYHQGWPKFVANLWMATRDDGLVAALYSPCEVKTTVRGSGVHLLEETDYPFHGSIRITVTPEKAVRFPMLLRVPAWATAATIQVNGTAIAAPVKAGEFARVEREWKAGDVIAIQLPMQPRLSRWFRQSVALERGPLVFSLSPGTQWVKLRDRGLTADWQVFPTGPWNYALAVDETSVAGVAVSEAPVAACPFTAATPPVTLRVTGRRLYAWRSEDGVALPLPASPVESNEPEVPLTLIPYAAAKLRVTAFPQLKS